MFPWYWIGVWLRCIRHGIGLVVKSTNHGSLLSRGLADDRDSKSYTNNVDDSTATGSSKVKGRIYKSIITGKRPPFAFAETEVDCPALSAARWFTQIPLG